MGRYDLGRHLQHTRDALDRHSKRRREPAPSAPLARDIHQFADVASSTVQRKIHNIYRTRREIGKRLIGSCDLSVPPPDELFDDTVPDKLAVDDELANREVGGAPEDFTFNVQCSSGRRIDNTNDDNATISACERGPQRNEGNRSSCLFFAKLDCLIWEEAIVPGIRAVWDCTCEDQVDDAPTALPEVYHLAGFWETTFDNVSHPNATTNPRLDPDSPFFSVTAWVLWRVGRLIDVDLLQLFDHLTTFFTETNRNPNQGEVGLLFYLEFLVTCNWREMETCDRGLGLEDAFVITLGAWLLLTFILVYFLESFDFLVGTLFWLAFPAAWISAAYFVSPICLVPVFPFPLPSIPRCFADDLCRLIHIFFRRCIPWDDWLPGLLIHPDGCPVFPREFRDCVPLGFTDGLDNLFFLFEWQWPTINTYLRTTHFVLVSWIRDVPFINDSLQQFTFNGNPPDALRSCFKWTVLNFGALALVLIIAGYLIIRFTFWVIVVIRQLFVLLTLNTLILRETVEVRANRAGRELEEARRNSHLHQE